MTAPDMLAAALAAHDAGLCVWQAVTDGSKRPASLPGWGKLLPSGTRDDGWTLAQTQRPTRQQVRDWFASGHPGIGVVCGTVSGGLELLELEARAIEAGVLEQLELALHAAGLGDVFDRIRAGYSEASASGGLHLLLRVVDGEPLGNLKLACTADHLPLIETRGEGGFAVCAPSHGRTAPKQSTGAWRMLAGGFDSIAAVTVAERDAVYDVCRTFDQRPAGAVGSAVEPLPADRRVKPAAWSGGVIGASWVDAVVAHLAATTTMAATLTHYGWCHDHDAGGRSYWTRPGKDHGTSAAVNASDRLLVFSSAVGLAPYDGKRRPTHDVLDVIAHYEHSGDRLTAARSIAESTGIAAAWQAERAIQLQADHDALAAMVSSSSTTPAAVPVRTVDTGTWQPDTVVERQVLAGPDGYRYTDVGNAQRLIARHGAHLRFVTQWKAWLVYADGRWHMDHAETMVNYLAGRIGAELLTREHFELVNAEPDEARRKEKRTALVKWATRSESTYGMHSTVTAAAAVPGVAVDHEALDADPWLLNVTNGTLELRTGVLRAHDPADLLTMQAAVAYDATAAAPRFAAFLEQVLPDAELRRFVARLFGVVLVGAQVEHVLPIALGGGANGKSTLTRIVADVLGDYAVTASTDLLLALKQDTHPTTKASLFRRRFAHSGELPPGAKLDEAQVKRLTGGDAVAARRMRENEWEFRPSHTLFVHANHRPTITGADDGIWRRVLLVPFDVQVPPAEQDTSLADRIVADEAAGVLRWMLDGLADYLEHGLAPPDRVTVATSNYRQQSDTAATFLADAGATFDPAAWTSANDVIAAHGEWFRSSGVVGHGTEAAHYQLVVAEMKRRGASNGRSRSKGGSFWQGVSFDAA